MFLTGPPGAGKTYVLAEYIQRAKRAGKRVAVTASTGIAATQIGGTTIHAWSGLGIKDRLTADDERWLTGNEKLTKRYNSTDVLVIDEVSMLHGARLDMVNRAAKILRQSEAAFGGLQVIMVGDMYQLPPVSRYGEPADFVHNSAAWHELDPEVCYLTEQHRQSETDKLLEILVAIRRDDIQEEHHLLLQDRIGKRAEEGIALTRLFAHNIDVTSINDKHLQALMSEGHVYEMRTKGNKARAEALAGSVLAPKELELRVGAEVMFVVNNFAEGYVNGSRGQVVDFEADGPVVRLMNGKRITVEPFTWTLTEDGRAVAEVTQLPLRLAWAITIHKSQGMSLDAAEIDLSRAFTPGMGYVALSRVRSLDGMYLNGINSMALSLHPDIHAFDALLRQASAERAALTEDIADEIIAEPAAPEPVDRELLTALQRWRTARARAEGIPPFMVAHNTTLEALARLQPSTPQQLMAVPGFGTRKAEQYGADILKIISKS